MHQNRKAYIYPSAIMDGGKLNLYINHVIRSLENSIDFLNRDYPSKGGIFDILKYLRRINIVFLNWPEEIPERRGGFIQAIFYTMLINYLKFRKVTIVWTLHNKESHVSQKKGIKKYIRTFTARKADYIITHAREGVKIAESMPGIENNKKIMFFHHPVLPPINLDSSDEKDYDILIWGMITHYKGIDQFLRFVKEKKLDKIKILIAGKISGEKYREEILSFRNDHIHIIDKFITFEELEKYIPRCRAVLFTYLEYSILSSGALMDTLRYSPLIIGPDYGAFRDLKEEGLILTYRNFDDLKVILENDLHKIPDSDKIQKFINANSWEIFGHSAADFIHSK